jgi:hypothetical protein
MEKLMPPRCPACRSSPALQFHPCRQTLQLPKRMDKHLCVVVCVCGGWSYLRKMHSSCGTCSRGSNTTPGSSPPSACGGPKQPPSTPPSCGWVLNTDGLVTCDWEKRALGYQSVQKCNYYGSCGATRTQHSDGPGSSELPAALVAGS